MKTALQNPTGQPVKKKYRKPRLHVHGPVSKITLKGGSGTDGDMPLAYQG